MGLYILAIIVVEEEQQRRERHAIENRKARTTLATRTPFDGLCPPPKAIEAAATVISNFVTSL